MRDGIRNIVVGCSSADEPDPVLEAALELAASAGATLHVVHGFELADPVLDAYARMGYIDAQLVAAHADVVQKTLEAVVGRVSAGRADTACHALGGSPTYALTTVVEQVGADLLVVGATRHGTLARTILGTTAQRVVRRVRIPILVAHSPFPAPKRVLLTTDLSPLSVGVHAAALKLLAELGIRPALRTLLVSGYGVIPPPFPIDATRRLAEVELGRFLARVAGRRPGAPAIEPRTRIGDAAKEIVAEAAEWGADLVVLGTHGRTGAERFFLGSVAEATLRSGLCSMLVLPQAALTETGEEAAGMAGLAWAGEESAEPAEEGASS